MFVFFSIFLSKTDHLKKIFLDSCFLPEVEFAETNSTNIIPHNTVVKYQCNLYYEAEGETVRSCVKGTLLPSFQTNPLKCASKLPVLNELVDTYKLKKFLFLNFVLLLRL